MVQKKRILGGTRLILQGVIANEKMFITKNSMITSMPKGRRVNPKSYLTREYINKHLEQFNDGISVIQTELDYSRYSKMNGFVGVLEDNTLFVLPKKYCDDIIFKANGNIEVIERELGFERGYFSDGGGLVRIDVFNVEGLNLRMPSGNEAGANSLWIPGGYTSGNIPEAVSDIIPLEETVVTRINLKENVYEL